ARRRGGGAAPLLLAPWGPLGGVFGFFGRPPPPGRPRGGPSPQPPIGSAPADTCGLAGTLSSRSSFSAWQAGQLTGSPSRTSVSNSWPHSWQAYSYSGIFSDS